MATHEVFTSGPMDDPLHQNITFWSSDGMDNIVPLAELQRFTREMALNGIQSGAQVALCVLVAGLLFIMTPRKSMQKPLFILNITSAIFAGLRGLFMSLYIVSPWTMIYTQFSNDLSYVSSNDYAYSYASSIVTTFLTATIFASLALQAHTVCQHLSRRWAKTTLIAVSLAFILVIVGFRLAQCILNLRGLSTRVPLMRYWVLKTSYALTMGGLAWFMGIFMWKLGYTIYVRRRNGWGRMSVFKTLFIASFFTMVIPFILTCIEFSEAHIDLSTWTLTTAACLLPLSTIWAKAADEEEQASLRLSRGSQNSGNVRSGVCSSHFASQCSTTVCSERKGSVAPSGSFNKSTIDTILEQHSAPRSVRDSTEVDLERMGVRVDRSYSVNDQGR